MSSRHQPANGADSAQGLADAIATVEQSGLSLNGRVDVDRLWELIDRSWPHHIEGSGGSGDARHTSWDVIDPAIPTRQWVERIVAEYNGSLPELGAIMPRCIACSEPARPNDVYCKGHDRLATYTAHESAGGIAAND